MIITGRRTPRGRSLRNAQKEANWLVSRERAANEHGLAGLQNWRILTNVRMYAHPATTLLRALLVLMNAVFCAAWIWSIPHLQAHHALRTVSWQGEYRTSVSETGIAAETAHATLVQRWSKEPTAVSIPHTRRPAR
ncbi:hypothetical protein [Streptomyces sp. 5-6(2022)]|uniref:hypothetical protein n=1 Tax=Streptomyces sp. 5-6(2022) TaxID=2936510 RepID=UPI0023B9E89F|nr:hypothetical protein [Streptomyces sp. 5-6(2022)]